MGEAADAPSGQRVSCLFGESEALLGTFWTTSPSTSCQATHVEFLTQGALGRGELGTGLALGQL